MSLSHYCPTAASLLFREDQGLRLIEGPAGFPASWPFEGLDAREAYPPFLRPGVLLGFDGLRAFEEAAVQALAEGDVFEALGRIRAASETLRRWIPADGALAEMVPVAFKAVRNRERMRQAEDPSAVLIKSLTAGTPEPPALPGFRTDQTEVPPKADLALRRYVASRLIAAWITYQAHDLEAVVRYLRLCLHTVLLFAGGSRLREDDDAPWKEAIRMSDLWILHHCDPELLAQNLG